MVSEGVRPHHAQQSSVGIWCQQIPNILISLETVTMSLKSGHSRTRTASHQSAVSSGRDFRVLFCSCKNIMITHLVCPRLCVSTSSGEHHCN